MGAPREGLAGLLRPSPQAVVGWLVGIATAILVALLSGAVQGALDRSLDEELRDFVHDQREQLRAVVLHKRVQLRGPGQWSNVLVLRDVTEGSPDRLVVLDENGDDLDEAFETQPAMARRRPRMAVYGPDAKRPFPTEIALEGQADIAGTGNPGLLLALDGGEEYARYPVTLTHSSLQGYRLTAPLGWPTNLNVGWGGHRFSERDAELAYELYERPPTEFVDETGHVPPFQSFRGDSFALMRTARGLFLLTGFVVAERGMFTVVGDFDCEIAAIVKRPPDMCGEASMGDTVPAFVNMKAWRLERSGVGVTTTFCSGPATIVRVSRGRQGSALRGAWPRYIRDQPRFC
jgi:hypothetical protein